MECSHAYIIDGVNYVICDFDGKVNTRNLKEIAPKLCQHQKYCGQVGRCALLPSWVNCMKLKPKEKPIKRDEVGEVVIEQAPVVQKRRSRKKKAE